MIAIVDYDAGNLHSVKNALDYLQIEHKVTPNPAEILTADGIILPGVGAFPDAMAALEKRDLVDTLRQAAEKIPLFGICLGMQVLFETGYEFTPTQGLGIIPGTVGPFATTENKLKIPHMGWNDLTLQNPCPLTQGLHSGDYVYFVHSFHAQCEAKYVAASTFYGEEIPALVVSGHVWGTQFHPEKSGPVGLHILENFGKQVAKC